MTSPNPLVGLAQQAVLYARSKIPNTWNRSSDFNRMVAENKAADAADAEKKLKLEAHQRREPLRAAVRAKEEPTVKPGYTVFGTTFFGETIPPELLDGDDKIMYTAKYAEQHRVGNCGEMAAVAYSYLREQRVNGVHYVNMMYAKIEKHLFVVIGAGSIAQEFDSIDHTQDQARRAFGNDAIICDPWLGGGKVFEMDEWEAAVKQMIAEVPWNGSDAIRFLVTARSSALTHEQKLAKWKPKPQPKT